MTKGSQIEQTMAHENIAFCYVELKTDGFEGDIAKLDRTDEQRDQQRFAPLDRQLKNIDIKMLYKEIQDSPVSRKLKRLVVDLDIDMS